MSNVQFIYNPGSAENVKWSGTTDNKTRILLLELTQMISKWDILLSFTPLSSLLHLPSFVLFPLRAPWIRYELLGSAGLGYPNEKKLIPEGASSSIALERSVLMRPTNELTPLHYFSGSAVALANAKSVNEVDGSNSLSPGSGLLPEIPRFRDLLGLEQESGREEASRLEYIENEGE
ncbi:hypothetical protein IEQ34_010938 [Dendrobium chrysotoxum]|uniref:Uncharacterized protein n=1 Tax=Dendrobium chrysotoxum TaxID=161865 RepID=A0AAV7GES3_DENCH|nr:hypothetical protein IEQ34_010938 [Dendrobium chrysotoxum]